MSEQNHEARIAALEKRAGILERELKQANARADKAFQFHLKGLAGLGVQILGGIGGLQNELLAFERAAASILPEAERKKILQRDSALETDAEKFEALILAAKKTLGIEGPGGSPPA